jgi:hypothetical protein
MNPPRAPSCDEPETRAFDFWVGEWNVNNRIGHMSPGDSIIRSACLELAAKGGSHA